MIDSDAKAPETPRDISWAAVRGLTEEIATVTLLEAAGALMGMLDIEGPEGFDRQAQMSPAERLLAKFALLCILETRARNDTFDEIVEGL